jgi:hypothetical protein
MADKPTTTAQAVWNAALDERTQIIHKLNHSQAPDPQFEARLAGVEEQLLGLPAPDLTGVTRKLELMWQAELHGLDADSRQKQLIVADLRRLSNA